MSILQLARLSRRIWWVKGVDKLLRLLHDPDRSAASGRRFRGIIPYGQRLLVQIDSGSFVEWETLFKGQYEHSVHELQRLILRPGMVAVDVGANVGLHTLHMAEQVGDGGHVLAIEPQPDIAHRLRQNLALNRVKNVTLYETACSRPGQTEATLVISTSSARTAHLSLSGGDLAARGGGTAGLSTVSANVSVTTLDALFAGSGLHRLDFVKIDVDGGEYDVLLGSEATLRHYRPHVLFEANPLEWDQAGASVDMVVRYLSGLSYRIYELRQLRGGMVYLLPVEGCPPRHGCWLAVPERMEGMDGSK